MCSSMGEKPEKMPNLILSIEDVRNLEIQNESNHHMKTPGTAK
jgi:hypothetical protein